MQKSLIIFDKKSCSGSWNSVERIVWYCFKGEFLKTLQCVFHML